MVTTASTFAAAAAGVAATVAPCAFNSSTGAVATACHTRAHAYTLGVRWRSGAAGRQCACVPSKIVTEWPALMRLEHIGLPMLPRPMKPTCTQSAGQCGRCTWEGGGNAVQACCAHTRSRRRRVR